MADYYARGTSSQDSTEIIGDGLTSVLFSKRARGTRARQTVTRRESRAGLPGPSTEQHALTDTRSSSAPSQSHNRISRRLESIGIYDCDSEQSVWDRVGHSSRAEQGRSPPRQSPDRAASLVVKNTRQTRGRAGLQSCSPKCQTPARTRRYRKPSDSGCAQSRCNPHAALALKQRLRSGQPGGSKKQPHRTITGRSTSRVDGTKLHKPESGRSHCKKSNSCRAPDGSSRKQHGDPNPRGSYQTRACSGRRRRNERATGCHKNLLRRKRGPRAEVSDANQDSCKDTNRKDRPDLCITRNNNNRGRHSNPFMHTPPSAQLRGGRCEHETVNNSNTNSQNDGTIELSVDDDSVVIAIAELGQATGSSAETIYTHLTSHGGMLDPENLCEALALAVGNGKVKQKTHKRRGKQGGTYDKYSLASCLVKEEPAEPSEHVSADDTHCSSGSCTCSDILLRYTQGSLEDLPASSGSCDTPPGHASTSSAPSMSEKKPPKKPLKRKQHDAICPTCKRRLPSGMPTRGGEQSTKPKSPVSETGEDETQPRRPPKRKYKTPEYACARCSQALNPLSISSSTDSATVDDLALSCSRRPPRNCAEGGMSIKGMKKRSSQTKERLCAACAAETTNERSASSRTESEQRDEGENVYGPPASSTSASCPTDTLSQNHEEDSNSAVTEETKDELTDSEHSASCHPFPAQDSIEMATRRMTDKTSRPVASQRSRTPQFVCDPTDCTEGLVNLDNQIQMSASTSTDAERYFWCRSANNDYEIIEEYEEEISESESDEVVDDDPQTSQGNPQRTADATDVRGSSDKRRVRFHQKRLIYDSPSCEKTFCYEDLLEESVTGSNVLLPTAENERDADQLTEETSSTVRDGGEATNVPISHVSGELSTADSSPKGELSADDSSPEATRESFAATLSSTDSSPDVCETCGQEFSPNTSTDSYKLGAGIDSSPADAAEREILPDMEVKSPQNSKDWSKTPKARRELYKNSQEQRTRESRSGEAECLSQDSYSEEMAWQDSHELSISQHTEGNNADRENPESTETTDDRRIQNEQESKEQETQNEIENDINIDEISSSSSSSSSSASSSSSGKKSKCAGYCYPL